MGIEGGEEAKGGQGADDGAGVAAASAGMATKELAWRQPIDEAVVALKPTPIPETKALGACLLLPPLTSTRPP